MQALFFGSCNLSSMNGLSMPKGSSSTPLIQKILTNSPVIYYHYSVFLILNFNTTFGSVKNFVGHQCTHIILDWVQWVLFRRHEILGELDLVSNDKCMCEYIGMHVTHIETHTLHISLTTPSLSRYFFSLINHLLPLELLR